MQVSGTGVDFLRLKLHQLSESIQGGLNKLQTQVGTLTDLVNSQPALYTQLPLVNDTLKSVLDVGANLKAC